MSHPLRLIAIVAVLGATAGCSRHVASTAAAPAMPSPDTRYGRIAAMRPAAVGPSPPASTVADVRASILRAIGPAAAGAAMPGGEAVEFIVRLDGGSTISVVQADAAGLRTGERIAISSGAPTHLARLLAVAAGH